MMTEENDGLMIYHVMFCMMRGKEGYLMGDKMVRKIISFSERKVEKINQLKEAFNHHDIGPFKKGDVKWNESMVVRLAVDELIEKYKHLIEEDKPKEEE
jgi:hypothetical protein